MFTEGESIYVCRGFGASPNQHRRAFSGNCVAVCWLLFGAEKLSIFPQGNGSSLRVSSLELQPRVSPPESGTPGDSFVQQARPD
jgi:hypothetical protein